MSKTSFALLILFLITVGILLSLSTIYSPTVLNSLPKVFPTQAIVSESTLSLTPNPLSILAGQNTSVQVIIDSQGPKPSLLQLEMAYDPAVIKKVTIVPGTFFQNPQVLLNTVNARNGRVSYALASGLESTSENNSKIAAIITITPYNTAIRKETLLEFLPKTVIRTSDSANTLKVAYGTKITVLPGFSPLASPSGIIR